MTKIPVVEDEALFEIVEKDSSKSIQTLSTKCRVES